MSSLLEQIARRRRAAAARRLGLRLQRSEQAAAQLRAGDGPPPSPASNGAAAATTGGVPRVAEARLLEAGERIVWRREERTGAGAVVQAPDEPEPPPREAEVHEPGPQLYESEPPREAEPQAEVERGLQPEVEPEPEPEPLAAGPAAEGEGGGTVWSAEDEQAAAGVRTVDHGWGPVKLSGGRRALRARRRSLDPAIAPAAATTAAPPREAPTAATTAAPPPEAPVAAATAAPPAEAPAPASEPEEPLRPSPAPGYLERGRIRRRARYLRSLREIQLRDIGGFMVELHRFGRERPELVRMKVEGAARTDAELRALERALGERSMIRELREAGIGGACASCGAVHGTDDRFCAACGASLAGEPPPANPAAPGEGEREP
jgi:hypothetical protein